MEGEMKLIQLKGLLSLTLALFWGFSFPTLVHTQEEVVSREQEERAQLKLRKTVKTRQYRGKSVEGEERVIIPGDSLWRILIQEKGFPKRHFSRYVVVISALNPHLKKPDILQIGDTIFIPIRPDEILGIKVRSDKGEAMVYRVKQGDNLYSILREQFGIQQKMEIRSVFDQVKRLNPHKKDWDILFVGESFLVPGQTQAPRAAAGEPEKAAVAVPSPEQERTTSAAAGEQVRPTPEIVGLDYGQKLPVQENFHLLEKVMAPLGIETHRGGEEVLPLQEGTIRIDLDSYPIIYNPKTAQKVILDLKGQIPPSLQTKLEADSSSTPIISMKKNDSLHAAANSLFHRLGLQSLPSNRPVVFQDRGVGIQVKGEWMVVSPGENRGREEIFIISLIQVPGETPDYLRDYLSFKGMKMKEILLPSSPLSLPSISLGSKGLRAGGEIEAWPREKRALVDALLKNYQIPFSTDHHLSVSLREGMRLETKLDRFFEFGGQKVGLLFRAFGREVKRALQEREGVRTIELDLQSLSSRELIARLLEALGERRTYREHRFPATKGGAKDKLVLTVPGFFLPDRSLLLTDREIPRELRRFFSEKGLRVVYFH